MIPVLTTAPEAQHLHSRTKRCKLVVNTNQHQNLCTPLLLLLSTYDAMHFCCMQLVLDAVPLERVSSQEFKKPDTPGRGVSRKGSLFRCNSIIDGHELDVSKNDW